MVSLISIAVAPSLFTLVGVLCKFAIVPDVYILLSPQEEEVHYLAAYSSKIFKSLFGFMLQRKNTNKKFSNAMTFIMKRSSFLKFLLVSSFNEYPWAIFSLLYLVLYLGCGCMNFWFYNTNDFKSSPLNRCQWIKNLRAKTTKHIPRCWEKSVKGSLISILSEL